MLDIIDKDRAFVVLLSASHGASKRKKTIETVITFSDSLIHANM